MSWRNHFAIRIIRRGDVIPRCGGAYFGEYDIRTLENRIERHPAPVRWIEELHWDEGPVDTSLPGGEAYVGETVIVPIDGRRPPWSMQTYFQSRGTVVAVNVSAAVGGETRVFRRGIKFSRGVVAPPGYTYVAWDWHGLANYAGARVAWPPDELRRTYPDDALTRNMTTGEQNNEVVYLYPQVGDNAPIGESW